MNLTIEQIITIIKRSNIRLDNKGSWDEMDYGYYHAHEDMMRTFAEIAEGKRTINGDWINDKNSQRPKRKQAPNRDRR